MGTTTIRLEVKVVPGSSRSAVVGWLGETLKVRVTAPAERGRANTAVEEALADALGVPRARARVVAGAASARKIVEVEGLSEADVYRRLPQRGQPEGGPR